MQQIVYLINCKDMKQRLLSLCLALTAMTLGAKAQSGSVLINETNFPDATFRNFVATYDTDKDKNLSKAELNKVFEIDVAGKGITNLTGIEHFTNLTRLYCNDNSLSSLNISNNQYLEILNCSNNELTALDVSSNKYLYSLGCFGNHISGTAMDKLISSLSLSLSEIGQWGRLVVCSDESAHDNTITTAQIKTIMDKDWEVWQHEEGGSQVTAMLVQIDELNFPDANFRAIVAGSNIDTDGDSYLSIAERKAVTTLEIDDKNISKLTGVEYFKELTELYCFNNKLTNLSVATNKKLKVLSCYGNQINGTAMTNLVNSLRSLPSGTEGYFYVGDSRAETDNIITPTEASIAKNKGWTVQKYIGSGWVDYAGAFGPVPIDKANFPSDNFRNYLLAQDYGKDAVFTEAEILELTKLNVSHKSISTLTGIEHFIALEKLTCRGNGLTSLDVSKNTALTELDCYKNSLTSLDVSKNTALTELYCYQNSLESLDVSKNTALVSLQCYQNSLTSLDVSKNTELKYLYCYSNGLTSLDVSNNTKLKHLECYGNCLKSLNVSKEHKYLTTLICYGNQISGDGMTQLINSLPTRSTSNYGELIVCADYVSTDNIITSAQVKKATGKGWKVMKFDSDGNGVDYAGYGDVNGDNQINQADLDLIVNIIMGRNTNKVGQFATDLNNDYLTNTADIVVMVNILKSLGK